MYILKMSKERVELGENKNVEKRSVSAVVENGSGNKHRSAVCGDLDQIPNATSVGLWPSLCWQQHHYRQVIMPAVVACCVRPNSTAKETGLLLLSILLQSLAH